jgi:hypothetical protein
VVGDLGDHHLRIVGLADQCLDTLLTEQPALLFHRAEVRADGVAAQQRARADDADPGGAFFGFLARISEEAAAKRDLPDAIAIAGSLQDALHAALDVLLRRAQQAGAVRADVSTQDIIVLLKGMLASIRDASEGAVDPALSGRVFAVLSDGLRQPG